LRIGVIAIQGNIEEHVAALSRVLEKRKQRGEVVKIKHRGLVPTCDALVIPGGESTTLGRLMAREGISSEVKKAAQAGLPIMGTCAGLILLAKKGDEQVRRTKQELLGLMDIVVNRNAFGRQRESFEVPLKISCLDSPFNCVFIRAPAITSWGDGVEILAKYDGIAVAARQGNLLALAFHPELTDDLRLHEYFLDMLLSRD